MKTKLMALTLLAISMTSCTRPENKATVRIQIPDSILNAKMDPVALRSGKVSAQSGGGWGVATPNNISNVNCYAILVGGPEEALRDKACTRGTGNAYEKFFYRDSKGFQGLGSSFDFEVEPGSARKFYVLGSVSSTGSCQDFNPSTINQSTMSTPMLLGTATADLAAGVNNVSVSASITDAINQELSWCSVFGSGGTTGSLPSRIVLRGPLDSEMSDIAKLGYNSCNRVRVKLKSMNDSDAQIDSALTANIGLTSISGTIGAAFASDDCSSTPISQVTFMPGDTYKDFYFKAASAPGTTDISVSAAVGSGSISVVKRTDTATVSITNKLRYFESDRTLAANTCVDIEYWAVDSQGRTGASPPSINLTVYDLNGTSRTPSALSSGSEFRTSCAGTPSATITSPSGVFGFYLGGLAKDFQIGNTGSPEMLVNMNLQPKAQYLNLSTTNQNPYASDCVGINVTARDAAGNPADLSGNDESPFSVSKAIKFNIYPTDWSSTRMFYDSLCTSEVNGSSFTLNAGNPNRLTHYQFLSTGTLGVRSWAGSYVSGNREEIMPFFPKWDPGVLIGPSTPPMVRNYASYFVPNSSSGGLTPKAYFGSIPDLNIVGTVGINTDALGTGNNTFNFATDTSFVRIVSGYRYATLNMLVKLPTISLSSEFFRIEDSGTNALLSIVTHSSIPGKYRMVSTNASSPAPTADYDFPANTWTSVTVTRGATLCSLYINAVLIESVACDASGDFSSIRIGGSGSNAIPGEYGEFFLVDREMSLTEIKAHHTYLKTRFNPPGLPNTPAGP